MADGITKGEALGQIQSATVQEWWHCIYLHANLLKCLSGFASRTGNICLTLQAKCQTSANKTIARVGLKCLSPFNENFVQFKYSFLFDNFTEKNGIKIVKKKTYPQFTSYKF